MLCNSHIVVVLCLLLQNSTTGTKYFWSKPCPPGAKMSVQVSDWAGCQSEGPGCPWQISSSRGLRSLLFQEDRQASSEGGLEKLRQLWLYEKWCSWCKAGCARWWGWLCHGFFSYSSSMCLYGTSGWHLGHLSGTHLLPLPIHGSCFASCRAQSAAWEVEPLSELPVTPWGLAARAGCCAISAG